MSEMMGAAVPRMCGDRTFEERVALLEEFARLEQFDALCRVEHVMAVLDCCRRTVYANRRLMAKRKKRGGRGIGFLPSDVRAVQALTAR